MNYSSTWGRRNVPYGHTNHSVVQNYATDDLNMYRYVLRYSSVTAGSFV